MKEMIKKEKKEKKENEKNKKEYFDDDSSLSYIKIDNLNKIEGLKEDAENQILMDLVNSMTVDGEDNIGKELNNFFCLVLPENNKEGDVLKTNYALSKKIRNNCGLKKNKNKMKIQHEEFMTQIMNIKINQNFILTREMNEKLCFVLAYIFKIIKKNKKFNNIEELIEYILQQSKKFMNLLDKYKDKDYNRNDMTLSSFIYNNNPSNNIFNNGENINQDNKNLGSLYSSRISQITQFNNNDFNRSTFIDYYINNTYKFREIKTKKPINVPLEVFILREKFEQIKRLKLILKRNINDPLLLEQKDIQNSIFILFNLKWLFPNLFEIEMDFTNENILKDEIIENNDKYEKFLKKTKRNKKLTYYQSEYHKKRIYDIYKKSIFNEQNKSIQVDDFEFLSETGSYSVISSVKDNKDDEIKKQEIFLNKYKSSLEMIIIYWYFVSNINTLKTCNFTIPINLENKILLMLKEKKIFLFDFNIFSNLSSDKILEVTLDFNSLDNKLFQQILSFLFKNSKMNICRLSFFPSEEYFEPQFLLHLLLTSENTKGSNFLKAIRTNEEIDNFLLRKLSEYFAININKFFCFFINKPTIKELSLIFDMPSILNKVDYYEIIIIKLIINMFIYLDKPNNTSYYTLNSFTIIAENLIFDNRKHPFLNHFFNNITIFKKKNLHLNKLTIKFKIFEITNIYKIIPYNINYLSLGYLDLSTFQYFVEYITSIEFNIHSKIKSLQISLGNTIISIEKCYNLLLKLLIDYPKNLEEISIFTSLTINYVQIRNLLEKTNYNTIEKIFIQFNKNSLEDNDLKNRYEKIQLKDNKDIDFINLFFIKRNEKNKEKILKIIYKVGNKYNKKFMDYNIFLCIEKFISDKDKKQIIIKYK